MKPTKVEEVKPMRVISDERLTKLAEVFGPYEGHEMAREILRLREQVRLLKAAADGRTVELVNELDNEQDRSDRYRNALITARACIAFNGSIDEENDIAEANQALEEIDAAMEFAKQSLRSRGEPKKEEEPG